MPEQIAVFELELEAVDHETDRRRWNGGPMPSRDADAALTAAVTAFRGVMREHGFDLMRTGYGVRAYEVDAMEDNHGR